MRFGVREICNVVLKARVNGQRVGGFTFQKGQPVLWFTSLKTSTVEGAVETVYATGGRGNSRLVAWEGDRTLTFTMEDALISPMSIAVLTGAGLIDSDQEGEKVVLHGTETVTAKEGSVTLTHAPADDTPIWVTKVDEHSNFIGQAISGTATEKAVTVSGAKAGDMYYVDYYYDAAAIDGHALQIDIAPDKFGGNYYLEAETLFRDEDGIDRPAEFVIPNCKVQSNFTFSMASSGDPSTFTFTIDAFPAPLAHGDQTKKVLCSIQIADDSDAIDSVEPTESENKTTIYV